MLVLLVVENGFVCEVRLKRPLFAQLYLKLLYLVTELVNFSFVLFLVFVFDYVK